jgi:phage shock protein E
MFLAFLKKLFGGNSEQVMELLEKKAIVLDVRTLSEYNSGHVAGSVHVPLDRIESELNKLKKYGKPIVTCCATGRRSGIAADMLNRKGIEAINGGSWSSVKSQLANVRSKQVGTY